MVKVEPDLPKPAADPGTFLACTADRPLMERRVSARGIKVDDAEEAVFGGQDVVYTI